MTTRTRSTGALLAAAALIVGAFFVARPLVARTAEPGQGPRSVSVPPLVVPMTPFGIARGDDDRGSNQSNGGSDPIIGTWLTMVTPDGPDAPPPFPQMLTFNEGGTAMQSATGPPIPALGNPGHGAWKRLNRRQIAATFQQFTFDQMLQRDGALKLVFLITLNEAQQTITSVDRVTIFDLDGNEIVTLGGVQAGRRLRVEVIH